MAELALTDATFIVAGVDLSDHIRSLTVNIGAEMLDDTAMGDTARSNFAGLKTWSIDVEFNQDYATGEVDLTLFPLIGAAAFDIDDCAPVSGATTTTNPSYSVTAGAILESYEAIAGSVGDMAIASATFVAGGGKKLERKTT